MRLSQQQIDEVVENEIMCAQSRNPLSQQDLSVFKEVITIEVSQYWHQEQYNIWKEQKQ